MSRAFRCASFVSWVLAAGLAGCEPSAAPKTETISPTSTLGPADAGAPPAATDSGAAAQPTTKTLFVREALVDCEGEGPMKCMQVRSSETEEWSLFYGNIEGFTYEPGYAYELKVTVTGSAKPPAGGSRLKHQLAEIVSKKKVGK